jgi:hypothetical protein
MQRLWSYSIVRNLSGAALGTLCALALYGMYQGASAMIADVFPAPSMTSSQGPVQRAAVLEVGAQASAVLRQLEAKAR